MRHLFVDHNFKLYYWKRLPTVAADAASSSGRRRRFTMAVPPALVAAGVPLGACRYQLQMSR